MGKPLIPDDVIDSKQVAKELSITQQNVFHLANRPKNPMPGYRVGKRWRFSRREVSDWIAANSGRREVAGGGEK